MNLCPPALPLDLPPSLAGRSLLLAYSGGGDSTALLHRLAQTGSPLRAVHVHHGLQAGADEWAARCGRQCASLGVAFECRRVAVQESRAGPEAAARAARYAALRAALQPGEVLVTAHHQNDQAETVLLNLLRGSGPAGLAGMEALTEFAPGWLWRPWLDQPRAALRAYAEAQGLEWVDDPHNADPRYARSLLRHELLPRLQARWPAAAATLARGAALQREAAALLRERAQEDLSLLQEPGQAGLSITRLRVLSDERQRNLLRHWIQQQGLPAPFQDSLSRIGRELFDAAGDAAPRLAWPGAELRRYRDRLYAMTPLPPAPQGWSAAWDGAGEVTLPAGCGRVLGQGLGACELRIPAPEASFRPAGSAHTRRLKQLAQERGIPPWVRRRTPVLLRAGRVAWIAGIGWSEGEAPGFLEWLDPPPATPNPS